MENRNELLFAVKDARRNLREGIDFRAADMLAVLEGIAPFLDRETILNMKCRSCDCYSKNFFPLSNDFWVVEDHEYCHAKGLSMKNLNVLKTAGCTQYSDCAQKELLELAKCILEEDLKPAFAERKLYDRKLFANYLVAFRISADTGKVYIEFGHKSRGQFEESDIKLYLIRRLDPGFGAEASQRIFKSMNEKPIIVVKASLQTRRMLDIDYVLEWIAQKRNMDIVYL